MMAPSNNTSAIKRIAIIGGGLTGWTAALALAKGTRGLGIEIVVIEHPSHQQADLHCAAAIPVCAAFHQWLGLDEKEWVAATGASFLLATRFNAWSSKQQDYFMPYSDHGFILNRIEFPQYAIALHQHGHTTDYDDYSLAAIAAKHGRFCHPSAQASSLFSTLSYGFTINTQSYTDYLRSFALQLKVTQLRAQVDSVQKNHDGIIESIQLRQINREDTENTRSIYSGLTKDGTINADFYIDCTGTTALLIDKTLNVQWQSHTDQLPTTHVVSSVRDMTPEQPLPSHRTLHTGAAGWIQTLGSQTHSEQQYFYHADFITDENARRTIGATDTAQIIPLNMGRRRHFWSKNCLALGTAAGDLGALGASTLHLLQSALRRFLHLFPAQLPSIENAAEFNRLTHLEYDHIEDFHSVHYRLAAKAAMEVSTHENIPYWHGLHTTPYPDRLAYKLELFLQRGQIPFYEGETFSSGVWASLLLGNNCWPERTTPLIYTMTPDEIQQELASIKKAMYTAADAMPSQRAYLQQHLYHR